MPAVGRGIYGHRAIVAIAIGVVDGAVHRTGRTRGAREEEKKKSKNQSGGTGDEEERDPMAKHAIPFFPLGRTYGWPNATVTDELGGPLTTTITTTLQVSVSFFEADLFQNQKR